MNRLPSKARRIIRETLKSPFPLTGGLAADCKAGALLLERLPACRIVLVDKGFDSDAIRRLIEAAGAAPNITLGVMRLACGRCARARPEGDPAR